MLIGRQVDGIQRLAGLRQFDAQGRQHAQPVQERLLCRAANGQGQLGRAYVGRMHQDFRDRQPAPLGVKVVDREAGHAQGMGGVETVVDPIAADVQPQRGVQQLEGRAHLVDAQRRAVEARVRICGAVALGLVVRQADHGEDFAAVDIGHHGGPGQRLEPGHRPPEAPHGRHAEPECPATPPRAAGPRKAGHRRTAQARRCPGCPHRWRPGRAPPGGHGDRRAARRSRTPGRAGPGG